MSCITHPVGCFKVSSFRHGPLNSTGSIGSTSSNWLICDHIAVWYHTPNTFHFCYIIFNLFSIACSYVEPYGLSLLTKLALPTLFMHFLHSSRHGHFWLQKITYYRAMKLTLRLMSSSQTSRWQWSGCMHLLYTVYRFLFELSTLV